MTTLFGQEEQTAELLAAARGGRMHHAWLLAGPEGVGKGSFAVSAARRLLAEAADPALSGAGFAVLEEHPTARLMAAESHPDYQRLTRLERESKGARGGDLARNISVDQVRGLQRLFVTAPTFSDRRVVVIDAIDDLEKPAANALLKNLEEPPSGTVFLLVSHAPGRLLPTIRSRCRLLRFAPLDEAQMTAAVTAALPDAGAREIAALVAAGEGAPGRAIGYAGLDIAALDNALDRLLAEGDATGAARAALARQLSTKAAQPRYELFLDRLPGRIAAHAKGLSGTALTEAITAWERARTIADGAIHLSADAQTTVFELAGLLARLAPATRSAKA